MQFAEDLTPFFRDFADAANLQASAVANGVISDAQYLEVLGQNVVSGSGPVALAIAADMASVAQGQALVITEGHNAGTYAVCGVEPDGTGLVLLRLEAQ